MPYPSRPRRSLRDQLLHALDSWDLQDRDRRLLEAMLREETEGAASTGAPDALDVCAAV